MLARSSLLLISTLSLGGCFTVDRTTAVVTPWAVVGVHAFAPVEAIAAGTSAPVGRNVAAAEASRPGDLVATRTSR
jgi:hypothetical protein